MSTETPVPTTEDRPIPVILVAFKDDMHPDLIQDVTARLLNCQVLPLVALAPNAEFELPSLADNPHNQDWYSIIRNTGGKNPVRFRADAEDIVSRYSNMLPVAIIEFDERCAPSWNLPQMRGLNLQ